jgi:hypothetical protein
VADSPFPVSTDEQLSWYLRVQAQEPVVRLVLAAGADTSLKDKDGLTALDHAMAGGPDGFDRLLLPDSKAQETPAAVCHLTLEQAPALRGFHLGQSLHDVLTHFRRFDLPPTDPCGSLTLNFNAPYGTLREYALRPEEFAGIQQLKLTFVDNKLTFVQLFYDSFPWRNMDEYLAQLSSSLHLSGRWRPAASGGGGLVRAHAIGCDGFEVIAGRASAPFVELHDTAALQTLLQRGIEWQTRKRRETEREQERRRQIFKP